MSWTMSNEAEAVLREWRTSTLNGLLRIQAVAAAFGIVALIVDAIARPGQWRSTLLMSIAILPVVLLGVLGEGPSFSRTRV